MALSCEPIEETFTAHQFRYVDVQSIDLGKVGYVEYFSASGIKRMEVMAILCFVDRYAREGRFSIDSKRWR